MKIRSRKHQTESKENKKYRENQYKMISIRNFGASILFLIFMVTFCLVMSFTPLTKEEQMENYNKMQAQVEPFRRNITECARQVKASMVDVENFLKRIPQANMQGKCFVACMLKRNSIIKKNKVALDTLIDINKEVYKDDSEVLTRLQTAGTECLKVVEGIFEICEYSSMFNDCMHMKMEHILDKVTIDRRMEALGQMSSDPDVWTEEDDELLKLVKDEL